MFRRLPGLLLSFDGRISRRTYWFGVVVVFLITFVVVFIGAFLDILLNTPPIKGFSFLDGRRPIEFTLSIAMFYPSFAVFVKRLHDRNKGAKWILLQLIPIVGSIWLIVETGFLKGTRGPNDWGDDPLGPHDPEVLPEAVD